MTTPPIVTLLDIKRTAEHAARRGELIHPRTILAMIEGKKA